MRNRVCTTIVAALLSLSAGPALAQLGLDLGLGGGKGNSGSSGNSGNAGGVGQGVGVRLGGSGGNGLGLGLGFDLDLGGGEGSPPGQDGGADVGDGQGGIVLKQDEALEAVNANRALPLADLLGIARDYTTDSVIDVRLVRVESFLLYELKALADDGEVSVWYFYAGSGAPVRRR